jgi:hypothetical protein
MKQRLFLLLMIVGLVGVLVLLNALTYVQTQKEADSELRPNRSSYNAGATGSQAFYTLLNETGRKAIRWQDSPEGLTTSRNKPNVFVVIGSLRREFTEEEATSLLRWVSQGGRLVLIDREPPEQLRTTTASWSIDVKTDPAVELLSIDPFDQKQMTSNTDAAKPVQPTLFTNGVNAVQPSRFAGWISFERLTTDKAPTKYGRGSGSPPPRAKVTGEPVNEPSIKGPLVHLAGNQKNLLVDVPFGSGRIVYLADPYIVSNAGINIVDNAQLAINIVSTADGTIAFDEYHQGYGSNANRLFQYFEGTPVIAIFVQCALLIGLIFASQSRRFARALPEKEPDRLSKLEYVTAMAELQRRTDAYDLAMENIFTDFRRRVTRRLGIDNVATTRNDVAQNIAERISIGASVVNELMLKCEAIIQGEPTNKAEVVALSSQLREIEEKLGIKRTPRGSVTR